MAQGNKAAVQAAAVKAVQGKQVQATTAQPQPQPATTAQRNRVAAGTMLKVGKLPRNLGGETKHGKGGTAGTWALLAKAVHEAGGQASYGSLVAIAADNGDKAFVGYAVRSKWLQPVA